MRILTLLLTLFLTTSCSTGIYYFLSSLDTSCAMNHDVTKSDLVGEWRSTTDLENTEERLIFFDDYTYNHRYISNQYIYESEPERWDLILSESTMPKVKMSHMKYFANGVQEANAKYQYLLYPSFLEDRTSDMTVINLSKGSVLYPEDEVIHLYPAICGGKPALAQMDREIHDPDSGVQLPIFRKDSSP